MIGAANVGELRPSQLMFSNGIGAAVDLPELSAIVLGLDEWPTDTSRKLVEPRLLAAVRLQPGLYDVRELRTPPEVPEGHGPFDDHLRVGVPVAPFPRWLRCPRCRLLAPLESGLFKLKAPPYRPDRARYVHDCDGKGNVVALAARFLLACRGGHLDDFPWFEWAHRGNVCARPQLELAELGASGQAADIQVRCTACDAKPRRMVEAFGPDAPGRLPHCRGRHPHLSSAEGDCDAEVRTILLGASNSWFPVSLSVLSIPTGDDALDQLLEDRWARLEDVPTKEVLAYAVGNVPELAALKAYDLEELWGAIGRRRESSDEQDGRSDLRTPEWEVLSDPSGAKASEDFRVREVDVPAGYERQIVRVVLAERLREVVALVGFTRIEAPDDLDATIGAASRAPLARQDPSWVPCIEVRGEGVFIQLEEEAVRTWETQFRAHPSAGQLLAAHKAWCVRRNLDPDGGWPGLRFLLLHTLAHALVRELALECGYGASAIRERIYATRAGGEGPDMAGVLLYTAAQDSEGTLGGLVSLGEPEQLGRLLDRALEHAAGCSSDPLCSEHEPAMDGSVHLAACHACQFAAETSCERGNRFLDRASLVDTFSATGLGYFTS